MAKKKDEQQELTPEEVEEQNGETLPDREVMSVINPGADGIMSTAPFEPCLTTSRASRVAWPSRGSRAPGRARRLRHPARERFRAASVRSTPPP
jgi:hypothetical protein